MKKANLKGFAAGLIVGLGCVTTAFAAYNSVFSVEQADSAIRLDGMGISLKTPMYTIAEKEGEPAKLYAPVREMMEGLGYEVVWDAADKTVNLVTSPNSAHYTIEQKVINAAIGYISYPICDFVEYVDSGITWKFVESDTAGVSIHKETYTPLEDDDKGKRILHTFSITFDKDIKQDQGEMRLTFEQVKDGKPLGNKSISIIKITTPAKPVIYLYPEQETDVRVSLDFAGKLTYTYPAYQNGWSVTARPDGTLTNHGDGREYSYLFWEGVSSTDYDMSKGFVVKGEDTVAFLQEKLAYLGLTPKEYNEFIVYWMPKMVDNPYNLITFQKEPYTDTAKLNISPEPDSLLRVFMAYQPLEKWMDIPEQPLDTFERKGFTAVEWGGAEVR